MFQLVTLVFLEGVSTFAYYSITSDQTLISSLLSAPHREIGYMFGAYKRYRNEFAGVLTGKGLDWGVSLRDLFYYLQDSWLMHASHRVRSSELKLPDTVLSTTSST